MIGKNELHLNAATVMQALQEYFDKRTVGPKAKVDDIKTVFHPAGVITVVVTVTAPPQSAAEKDQ